MEAVIAQGQFVRMRHSKEFEEFELNRLDAELPDACIYLGDANYPNVFAPGAFIHQAWRPKYPKRYHDQLKAAEAQAQMMQAQQAQICHGIYGHTVSNSLGVGGCGGGYASHTGTAYAGIGWQLGNSLGAMGRSLGNLFSSNPTSVKI